MRGLLCCLYAGCAAAVALTLGAVASEAQPAIAPAAWLQLRRPDAAAAPHREKGCKPPRGPKQKSVAIPPPSNRVPVAAQAMLAGPISRWTRSIADPAHSVLQVQNTSAGPMQVEWVSLNGRAVFGSLSDIQLEIDAIPPEADGSAATRVFRFVTDNRRHGFPLTTRFDWFLTPTLFFNSSGETLCGEAAEEVNMLASDRGLMGREWGLNGHLVAEIQSNGRWQMYDADYGVYFLNRAGQIASLAELETDPSLITDPVLRLVTPGPWSPYQPAYANLFATSADNWIRRTTPRATLPPRALVIDLPRGARLRFPGRFAVAPPDYLGAPVEDYADLMLRLPAGSAGMVSNPFLVHALRGVGHVVLAGQAFEIGSAALQAAIDARTDPLEQMELLDSETAIDIIYLVNPQRWMLAGTSTLELRKSAAASLAVEVKPSGDPSSDSDLDLVPDDGDANGIVGDAPCRDHETAHCDDNCVANANSGQHDADADGVGNACDGDFDQDELITNADLATLQACSTGGAPVADPGCEESDLNEDGGVDSADRAAFDALRGVRAPSFGCGAGPELAPALVLLGLLRRRVRPGASAR